MSFQTQVNQTPAPAVAGDFASTNPRSVTLFGPGGPVAGPLGVVTGRFGWIDDANMQQVNSFSPPNGGVPNGFVKNSHNALITTYLGVASMVIPAGFSFSLFNGGDFWAKNDGTTEAVPGQKAFAGYADGKVSFAAAGATPANGGTGTSSTIAANTASYTTSTITDNLLTVVTLASGAAVPGAILTGTNVATGTMILEQVLPLLTGEALKGVGRYLVSIGGQAVTSTTISAGYGTLTVGGTVTGTFSIGEILHSASATSGTVITALGTGTGGAGTYIVSPSQTVSSGESMSAYGNIETGWYCRSFGAPGELVKISSFVMG